MIGQTSTGTAGDGFRADPEPHQCTPRTDPGQGDCDCKRTGRHRAAPAPRAPKVIGVAAGVVGASALVALAAGAVAPEAKATQTVEEPAATDTVAEPTPPRGGPLVIPSIGALPSETPTPSAAPQRSIPTPEGAGRSETPRSPALEAVVTSEATTEPTDEPKVEAEEPVTEPDEPVGTEPDESEEPTTDPEDEEPDQPTEEEPTGEEPPPIVVEFPDEWPFSDE